MFKKIIFFISLFFGFLSRPALAQTEFITDYIVNYSVNSDGSTYASLNIKLTNQLSNIYATEFTLSIGSTKLSQIKAFSESENLNPKIIQGQKTTNIIIPFNQKVLGKDKTQTFTVEFVTKDFSHRLGSVWEISIPRLSKTDNLRAYDFTLSVPNSFGEPASITPKPINIQRGQNTTLYRFNSQDLFETGVSATFGQTQYFDFSLNYNLENTNLFPIKTEIALPPDTPFQTIVYSQLEPKPETIQIDADNNWLASYYLPARSQLKIIATGSAEINLQPKTGFLQPIADLNPYLQEKKYWEISNPKIKKLASELKTPEKIYQYLVDNLIYDYGRLSDNAVRFGAANTLDNPNSAICREFTDLFVALTRSAGIPSRAVNGFAYTTNPSLRPLSLKKDVLHAWPEYYDQNKQLWIPIDPTWGNTTGGVDFFSHPDLNHFAFVFLGIDSEYPIPPGAYKTSFSDTKDIEINFGQPIPHQPQVSLEFHLSQTGLSGVPLKGELVVSNSGNIALYELLIDVKTQKSTSSLNQLIIPVLPPFAKQSFPLEINTQNWQNAFTEKISAISKYGSTEFEVQFFPFYRFILFQPKFYFYLTGIISLLVLSLIIIKIRAKI